MVVGGINVVGDSETAYNDARRWTGRGGVKGPTWAKMPLLTVTMLGMQIVWSVEMGYASPYLLSLGLSKSWMSMVFVAGPLSGLIMQPVIGALSDRCTSKLGRRRPFIILGCSICFISLLLLGYTKDITLLFGLSADAHKRVAIGLAVLSIYFIDFSINAVMATDRALLVDILPAEEQELGNAWAGRMSGAGSVTGFFIGNVSLPKQFPFLGRTQLEVLSVLSGLLLLLTHGVTVCTVRERVLMEAPKTVQKSAGGLFTTVRDVWSNLLRLPSVILQICIIQFLSWIGWFPILFYTTLWISDIYHRSLLPSPSPPAPSRSLWPREVSSDESYEAGALVGNTALLYSSVVAMAGFVFLPFLVNGSSVGDGKKTYGDSRVDREMRSALKIPVWWKIHISTLWTVSQAVFALSMAATWFTNSVGAASFIIAVTGFSWSVSLWAPFALLGEAIHSSSDKPGSPYALTSSRDPDLEDSIPLRERQRPGIPQVSEYTMLGSNTSDIANQSARTSRTNIINEHSVGQENDASDEPRMMEDEGFSEDDELLGDPDFPEKTEGVGDKAGVILGIHNIFIVIPQFLITGLSAVVFALSDTSASQLSDVQTANEPHLSNSTTSSTEALTANIAVSSPEKQPFDSIGLMFRIGGFSAAFACVLCYRLSKQLQRRPN